MPVQSFYSVVIELGITVISIITIQNKIEGTMSNTDHRYSFLKTLIEAGEIKELCQIIDVIPASIVYKDLGINYSRFKKLIARPKLFTLEELILLASFCKMEPKAIINLAYDQIQNDKNRRTKSKTVK